MAYNFPLANHLTDEEVDYELFIREKFDKSTDDYEANRCMLRRLFFEDARTAREYESPFTIGQEYNRICLAIEELRERLFQGLDDRVDSRLRHYWQRVERIRTDDAESEFMRQELLDLIQLEQSRVDARRLEDENRDIEGPQKQKETFSGQEQSGLREKALEDCITDLKKQVEYLQSRRTAKVYEADSEIDMTNSEQGILCSIADGSANQAELSTAYQLPTGCLEQDFDLSDTEAVAIEEYETKGNNSREFLGETDCVDEDQVQFEEVKEQQGLGCEFKRQASCFWHIERRSLQESRVEKFTDECEVLSKVLRHNLTTLSPSIFVSKIVAGFNRTVANRSRDINLLEDPPPSLEQHGKILDEKTIDLKASNLKHSTYFSLHSGLHCSIDFLKYPACEHLGNSDNGRRNLALLRLKCMPAVVKSKVGSQCFQWKGLGGEMTKIFCWKIRKKFSTPNSS